MRRIGVVIGRFQVPSLHPGHTEFLHTVFSQSDQVCVLIGVSPVDGQTKRNPLSYQQRVAVVGSSLRRSDIMFMPLLDRATNREWSERLDELLTSLFPTDTVTLFSGAHDSFEKCYGGRYSVVKITEGTHADQSGTSIRGAIPEGVDPQFIRGQIYALTRQYPHGYACVDVAVTNKDTVLLIQRADNKEWGFVGGFVDPEKDLSYEAAAARELFEETGLAAANGKYGMVYSGSFRVNDWRYRGGPDAIFTSFFITPHSYGAVKINEEECSDYIWYSLSDPKSNRAQVAPVHVPLMDALVKSWRSANV